MKRLLHAVALALLLLPMNTALANDSTPSVNDQIQELKDRVRDLEDNQRDPEGTLQSTATSTKKLEKIKVEGYIQFRYSSLEDTVEGTDNVDQFNLRRGRLGIKANPFPELEVKVQGDFAKSVSLRDAYAKWSFFGNPTIGPSLTVGQMKWPFGLEVTQSSSVRETPERALFSRELFNGERDLGVTLSGKEGVPLSWTIGVFNGTGANKSDNNNDKDFVGRLGYQVGDKLDVGGSAYIGRARVGSEDIKKNRYGGDVRWYPVSGIMLKGEYVKAEELGRKPWGWLGQLNMNVSENQVLVLKFDQYDYDGLAEKGKIDTWQAGVLHQINANMTGKLFWSRENDRDGVTVEILTKF